MRLFLASGNPHKASELQALSDALRSGGPAVEIVSAASVGGMPAVDEDTGTFVGNARKKALALRALLPEGGWALADDSGLCVAALRGGPGVESAYFAGRQHDPAANLAKLVTVMAGIPEAERAAEFVCVLFLAGPGGSEAHFEGRCPGRLSTKPRGTGGFGYDPLFIPDGFAGTLAEMPPEVKARVGHRGRAWAALAGWLAARG
jgi:XTP/dITP diphosphohydrolase